MILLGRATYPMLILLCFLVALPVSRSSQVITDPAISRRCNALLKKRLQTIEFKQKVYALIERNRQAFKSAPPNRRTIRQKLKRNHKDLQKRLDMARYRITRQEETIIRKGCPSVPL